MTSPDVLTVDIQQFRAEPAPWMRRVREGHQVCVRRGEKIVAVLGRSGYRPTLDDSEMDRVLEGEPCASDRSWLE